MALHAQIVAAMRSRLAAWSLSDTQKDAWRIHSTLVFPERYDVTVLDNDAGINHLAYWYSHFFMLFRTPRCRLWETTFGLHSCSWGRSPYLVHKVDSLVRVMMCLVSLGILMWMQHTYTHHPELRSFAYVYCSRIKSVFSYLLCCLIFTLFLFFSTRKTMPSGYTPQHLDARLNLYLTPVLSSNYPGDDHRHSVGMRQ